MWFKNLQIYRLPSSWEMSSAKLEACLRSNAFVHCTSIEMQSQGWDSPRQDDLLIHTVNRQMLLALATEKKLLPPAVIRQISQDKARTIEEQQGFKLGRKQKREIKEQVTDELMPRAFNLRRTTWSWIDPINGWLIVDASSTAKAEEILTWLHKSVPEFPATTLEVTRSPTTAMTEWLASGEAPCNFTIDQEAMLQSCDDNKATIRYVRHALEPDDIQHHIASGKHCTRLALTWADRVSFVLTDDLALKRITPLEVLTESTDASAQDDDERFDSDFALMTSELSQMLGELVAELGGEKSVN